MKLKIEKLVYNFFIKSRDFNGIPLRRISKDLNIDYVESINVVISLVYDDIITIQSSSNPHIIRLELYPIEIQIKILQDAKDWKVTSHKMGEITFFSETSDFPICLYPSPNYLKKHRSLVKYKNKEYSKRLALAEPHLKPVFFDIEVLDRYYSDPRFDFRFKDFSGRISCKYDENNIAILRNEDQIFLKTFGLGFDEHNNRVVVAFLRYLTGLTSDHQMYWKSREVKGECKMLREYYENSIEGNWCFSHSIFSAFIGEMNYLNVLSIAIFGKPFFIKTFEEDNPPKAFTFFFTPTTRNYDEFILLLDKMISENISKDFFKGIIELYEEIPLAKNMTERKAKGTLRLFEEWLVPRFTIDNQQHLIDLFVPFKKIRKERQNPAHKIKENVYDKKYFELQKDIIEQAYWSMRGFRKIFQQHRNAKTVKIPEWLDNGRILAV